MAGYSRQSVADIIANAVIKAAPVNAEFNAIRDAFSSSTGHRHDGNSTEGAYVPLIADLDGKNKAVIDTINNRISFYVEIGGSPVEQLRIQDGVIVPVTDNDVDLGTASLEFKDIYIDGVGYIDTLAVHENATVAGNLTVEGNTILGNAGTDTVTVTAGVASDILPIADGTYDLGSSTKEWQDLWIDGTANIDSLVADTADINAGSIDNTVIGATTPANGTFTTLNATTATTTGNTTVGGNLSVTGTTTLTGLATIPSVDINSGNIDGTTIGSTSTAAGSFTTVNTSGQATLASANIDGGTIDGAVIGGSSAAAITGTTITANTGFTGALTGNVTGNVTGSVTGNVTGNLTGNVTGNVTASSGTSSFTDVIINGTLNMNAGTTATITNLTSPTNTNDAATKGYVDTAVAGLIDSAPGTLDTLNELAAALGDDPNFSTTITNSIATKLPLSGGTMSGDIAMGTNSITGLADPTANQDAATKNYVDTQDATKLSLSGGIMTGGITMNANKITATYTPSTNDDLTNKSYVDSILGSATSAATSAAAAATSASNAATSESNAANSASASATSAADAAASYDSFDDRYLGAKGFTPSTDNDGDPLLVGALYFDTNSNELFVWGGSAWTQASFSAGSYLVATNNLSDLTDTAAARENINVDEAGTALALAIALG